MRLILLLTTILFSSSGIFSQTKLSGTVNMNEETLPYANVFIKELKTGTTTNADGYYEITIPNPGTYHVLYSYVGNEPAVKEITVSGQDLILNVSLTADAALDEVVVTGTMKEIEKLASPVPVEVYTTKFFKKNPTPSLYDALQNVNGVRPQLNCNVCNTGDIHINGLEGPYTMVLIDGMPIVSGLSTVYGLSGIPNALIERVEIVKGPASSLYGSEAVGGLINVITKNANNAPVVTMDLSTTSWLEHNADLGIKTKVNDRLDLLTGINLFNYNQPIDNNNDGFTDVTLQNKISVFQKWHINRKSNKLFSIAGRYFTEERWGGEMNWTPEFRGTDSIYGESIITNRYELIGNYQLPTTENINLSFSYNSHNQNSFYGDMPYMAQQNIGFTQLTWNKSAKNQDFLLGVALRYNYYDDNTVATELEADENLLPGIFVQDEIHLNDKHKFLLGMRYDYHSNHGDIFTPRFAYKWSPAKKTSVRLNAGTGYRVVNLFTEDHAALTGSRDVIIQSSLKPEQSINVNLNVTQKIFGKKGRYLGIDASAWHTQFSNQIIPDYTTNANQIIYDNLNGYSVSQGVSVNLDWIASKKLSFLVGATYMDVFAVEENEAGEEERFRPLLTEGYTATWAVTYQLPKYHLKVDYTGNLYGPMDLPVLSDLDPRPAESPTWSLQNIQLTYAKPNSQWEWYGGVKNILNFTPAANSIARPNDPFDRNVTFDADGNALPTPNNPNALTFDPSYVYAPNQGIRGFIGVRYTVK